MNTIFTVAGIGIISAGLYIILKQYRPEFAFAVTLISGIILLLFSVSSFKEIIENINELISISGTEKEKYKVLLKCLGICIITKIASETCKDCGENSVASKIDLAGKTFILASAMPLFGEIIGIIKELVYL